MRPAHLRSIPSIDVDAVASAPTSSVPFPDFSRFATIFAGLETPPEETTNPDAAFFSPFASRLADSARRLTAPSADVLFDRCGFATSGDLASSLGDVSSFPSQALLFADADDGRFLVAAPASTLRLLFDAALGFDVAALCANEELYNDFNDGARQPLTPFEEQAFAPEFVRFASLSPLAVASASNVWRPASSLLPPSRAAFALDDGLYYWERRFLRLAERDFPWTVVFSTRFLASVAERATRPTSARTLNPSNSTHLVSSSEAFPAPRLNNLPRSTFGAPSTPWDEPPAAPPPSLTSPSALPSVSPSFANSSSFPNERSATFDLSIVVEQGKMSAESWRRLKPGDILTTNVPANALFLGLLDGAPRFLCRPGLFRGVAAVQIKSEAGDDRE